MFKCHSLFFPLHPSLWVEFADILFFKRDTHLQKGFHNFHSISKKHCSSERVSPPKHTSLSYFVMACNVVASHASFGGGGACFTQLVLLTTNMMPSIIHCNQLPEGFRTEINLDEIRAKLLLNFQSWELQRCHNNRPLHLPFSTTVEH